MKWTTTSVLTAVTAFLTIMAALPYELGQVADILPPEWKTRVAIGGALATMILRLIKTTQAQAPSSQSTSAPENPTPPNQ